MAEGENQDIPGLPKKESLSCQQSWAMDLCVNDHN